MSDNIQDYGKLFVVQDGEDMNIVRAKGATQALKHVVAQSYEVRAATADDVEFYLGAGGVIEVVGYEPVDPVAEGSEPAVGETQTPA